MIEVEANSDLFLKSPYGDGDTENDQNTGNSFIKWYSDSVYGEKVLELNQCYYSRTWII